MKSSPPARIPEETLQQAHAWTEFAQSPYAGLVLGWLHQQGYMGSCPFLAANHDPTRAAQIAGKQQLVAALNNEILAAAKVVAAMTEKIQANQK